MSFLIGLLILAFIIGLIYITFIGLKFIIGLIFVLCVLIVSVVVYPFIFVNEYIVKKFPKAPTLDGIINSAPVAYFLICVAGFIFIIVYGTLKMLFI